MSTNSSYNPFAPAPAPPSNLGLYRVLSPRAGIRVSPLCLGSMSFGTKYSMIARSIPKEQSFEVLDEFYNNGGNFVDTASS
jgi:aryl-alcohol dehydrogenase-like predicted oxidoreductase